MELKVYRQGGPERRPTFLTLEERDDGNIAVRVVRSDGTLRIVDADYDKPAAMKN